MTRDELKEYFKRGKIPTESNFSELMDFFNDSTCGVRYFENTGETEDIWILYKTIADDEIDTEYQRFKTIPCAFLLITYGRPPFNPLIIRLGRITDLEKANIFVENLTTNNIMTASSEDLVTSYHNIFQSIEWFDIRFNLSSVTSADRVITISNQNDYDRFITNIRKSYPDYKGFVSDYTFLITCESLTLENITFSNCEFIHNGSGTLNFTNSNLINCTVNSILDTNGSLIASEIRCSKLYLGSGNIRCSNLKYSDVSCNILIVENYIECSNITCSNVTGSIQNDNTSIRFANIDNLNFKHNLYIYMDNCRTTLSNPFSQSSATIIYGNIINCNFYSMTESNIRFNGVKYCKLNSILVSNNKYFADVFGTKNASEHGENYILD